MKYKVRYVSLLVPVAVLLALGLWVRGFWFTEVFALPRHNAANRAALREIHEAIPLGSSHAEALAAYWQHRSRGLRLAAESAPHWNIRMPLEFGATDWNLRLEFQSDKVTAVRVRTTDGPAPEGGPADKDL